MSTDRRYVWCLAPLLAFTAGCLFEVAGLPPLDAARTDDFAVRPLDFATLDSTAPPDLAAPPDMLALPRVLLALDARSSALFAAQGQPYLPDRAETRAHYRFDEPSGNVTDRSPNRYDLVPAPGFTGARQVFTALPPPMGAGFTRTALDLRGAGLAAANPTQLDFAKEDFTVEVWFKIPPGYRPAARGCDPLFSKGTPPGRGYLACVDAAGKLRMTIGDGSVTRSADSGAATFADGAWHLAALVYRTAQANGAAMYVDGRDLAPNPRDLSSANGVGNGAAFTVGGAMDVEFRGALAELAVHATALSLAEHRAHYRAADPPWSSPVDPAHVAYDHGPVCPVVGNDPGSGEQVSCYAGSPAAQFAPVRLEAADATLNAGRLGMLLGASGPNHAYLTEMLDQWPGNAKVTTNAVVSPRGDRTADTLQLPDAAAVGRVVIFPDTLTGNGPTTFSIWLKGQDNTRVYMTVSDLIGLYGREVSHCLVTLTSKWKRYTCSRTFAQSPPRLQVLLDTIKMPNENITLPAVTFDAWGAQVERAPAASSYVPNPSPTSSAAASAPVRLTVANPGARYLGGAAGRIALAFTGDGNLADRTMIFDAANANNLDRRLLGRGAAAVATAAVHDSVGGAMPGSSIDGPALMWSTTHALGLVWNAGAPVAGNARAALAVDAAVVPGRTDAFKAAAAGTLHVGQSTAALDRPSGALHHLTIWDLP